MTFVVLPEFGHLPCLLVCSLQATNAVAGAQPYFVRPLDGDAAEGAFGRLLVEKKAPGFRQLFQQAVELGDEAIHQMLSPLSIQSCDMTYDGGTPGVSDFGDDLIAIPA